MKKTLKILISIISLLFISYFGSIVAICVSNNESEFYGMVNNDGYGHFDFTGYRNVWAKRIRGCQNNTNGL